MNKSLKWRIAQFFEILWWEKYLKNKKIDTYLEWKRKYWEGVLKKIEDVVTPAAGMKILDAGCGPAGIFIALKPLNVTAIDPLLDQYEQKLPHFKPDMYPYVTFETIPLENFETTNQFDTVFCFNAINHVSDLPESIKRLVNSAKNGGKIVLSIDAHNHTFFKSLFRSIPGDILHPHQYDLDEYTKMLTNLNCNLLKTVLIKKEFLFNHYMLVVQKD